MKIGILYSKYVKNTVSKSFLKKLLEGWKWPVSEICVDDGLETAAIMDLDIVLNCLGKYYREEHVRVFKEFYREGGSIVHLGAEAFSIPYTCLEGEVIAFPKTVSGIRCLGVIDDYYACDLGKEQDYVIDVEQVEASYFRSKSCVSACYRLAEYGEEVRSRLDPLMVIKDKKRHPLFVPVMRVWDPLLGNHIFYQFDLEEEDWEQEAWLADSLKQVLFYEEAKVSIDSLESEYGRYLPEEKVVLETGLRGKGKSREQFQVVLKVYRISGGNQEPEEVFARTEELQLDQRYRFSVDCEEEGRYIGEVSLYAKEGLLEVKRTGFYVLADASVGKIMEHCGGIGIHKGISDEFCVRKEELFPIHGTTYFVTDIHRNCFEHFNLNICMEDMKLLKEDGFNVLRTGKWKDLEGFYQEDGNLRKSSIRALQAFFISAAELGLMVQFVMGNVSFNHWNRESSAIHDPEICGKAQTAVECFVENFKEYSNVLMDVLNEPSYSYQGGWKLARPSYSEYERQNFIKWLKTKYDHQIIKLRIAWNISSDEVQSFEEIKLPQEEAFDKALYRTEQRTNHILIADFFQFARESYHGWIQRMSKIARERGPEMLVIMGRDESLRIPSEQDMMYERDLDMVCWHQWNYNGAIFTEQMLNRVPGEVCCAQEIGIYQYDSIRGGKRYTEQEIGISLERKLIYSLGNWVQWQAFHDPYMGELSENSLGLFRADKTITPAWEIGTKLLAKEEANKEYQTGGQIVNPPILTLYPASWYFGTNPDIVQQGMRVHVDVIYNHLKQSTVFVPDYAFADRVPLDGVLPALVILPCAQNISEDTWEQMKKYLYRGGTVLINGVIDQDLYFREKSRISELEESFVTEKLLDFERIQIETSCYDLDFRKITGYGDVGNLLSKGNVKSGSGGIYELTHGKGQILYCPVPIELSDNMAAVKELYHHAIKRAGIENTIYKVLQDKPSIFLHAFAYEKCTVYSVVNEGEADGISWVDLRSGMQVELKLPTRRSGKIWLDPRGILLDSYGQIEIKIKGESVNDTNH